ncbi:MAG TPA: sugar phosphate isomerase/epimerase, partial [Chloroflexota bacterium]|nr:sugar phosphate isomerase/epimerase [Chloroflexota bacterium]
TGQWADLPLEDLAAKAKSWGYDGLELACWGDHLDIERAAEDPNYCGRQRETLRKNGLECWAISAHLQGQLVLDRPDQRGAGFAPEALRNDPEKVREWGTRQMKLAPLAAKNMGVTVVNGFTGSSIWHLIYPFPPQDEAMIEEGYQLFAERWNPIFDEFDRYSVRFGLEVHPTEIAFDYYTAQRALEAVNRRPAFGFNLDPSHLIHQGVDPALFARDFADRIYHTHIKDAHVRRDGRAGILGSYINFGDARRGWEFRSPGHGDINFGELIRALNDIGYQGPLSVEWEDAGMDREHGAREAAEFCRKIDFKPSERAFDAAFQK